MPDPQRADNTMQKSLGLFAPAKINLFLHILNRRDSGYHDIESLVTFADIGDQITIKNHPDFSFTLTGPYGAGFNSKERDFSPGSSNLVVKAVWELARIFQKSPSLHITLEKNLPIASGIGGGSADAAAIVWGLMKWWGIVPSSHSSRQIHEFMCNLGADVPVCYECTPSFVQGIGDKVSPCRGLPEIAAILINPGKKCLTSSVFAGFDQNFSTAVKMPDQFNHTDHFIEFLKHQDNDLTKAACDVVPEIENILYALQSSDNCLLARLSGSGATCFGLYEDIKDAEKAAAELRQTNPDWWIKPCWLNRTERY